MKACMDLSEVTLWNRTLVWCTGEIDPKDILWGNKTKQTKQLIQRTGKFQLLQSKTQLNTSFKMLKNLKN